MPEIATVVSGDVVSNQVHPVLGLSGPKGWQELIANIDEIERLSPEGGRARHKEPEASDEAVEMLSGTCDYISDFGAAAENAVDAKEPKR